MKKTIWVAAVLFFATLTGKGQAVYSEKGTAIKGYDVISYFEQGGPVKGSEAFALQWNNTRWLFSSQEHLELFKANPDLYAPQYGGWCAYGVSENHKSPTDPHAFTVVDGKLYLNYNQEVMHLWRSDTARYIPTANQNWITLRNH